MPENSESEWTWLKCQWFFVLLTWLAGLPLTCVHRLRRMSSSAPILPITAPGSPKRKCANWRNWWWGRKCKCTCTSPRCRRFRRWRKNWWKLPRRIWRRIKSCRCPKWEPDQKSLWVRVIKASRLDGFKMAVKEKMHFAARIMYIVSYKLFTGIAIYLIIVSSVKILKTPIIYKHAGKIHIENIEFSAIDVCPSNLFSSDLLQESNELFERAKIEGVAEDSFGEVWSLIQAAKLYYYIFKRCQATRSHSRFFDSSYSSLNPETFFKYNINFTLRHDLQDEDFKKILQIVKKHGGTVNCSKMLAACRWGPHRDWNCSEIFEVVETETGQCCRLKRINRQVLRESSQRINNWGLKDIKLGTDEQKQIEDGEFNKRIEGSLRYQKIAGMDQGLTFVIIMETENVACPMNSGNAYMVYVHSTLDVPQTLANGILIEPNHEVFINVNAIITLADKAIINLPEDIRQCYFQEEKCLSNSNCYTENNCRTECRSLLFQEHCKCHKLGTTAGKREIICGLEHAECEEQIENAIQQNGYAHMCMSLKKPMKCYHGCTEIEYNTAVSSTSYFHKPSLVKKMNLKKSQASAIVRIGFGSDTAEAREIQQQYDFWEIVGIIGGILGLMIGVDFMTAIHLIYSWGIYFKGLWLKRKLANSVVVRSIVNVTSILDAVHSVSTQTPTDCRPHPLDFAKRKNFKRIFIKRKGAVAPTDPAISLEPIVPDPIAELTSTNGTEMTAGPSRLTTMADVVMTNELLKNVFGIHKLDVDSVDLSDSVFPVLPTGDIDPVPFTDHILTQSNETITLVDRITSTDAVAVINSLASLH